MRFKQRRFHRYSENALLQPAIPTINNLNYTAAPGNTLVSVQRAGFYYDLFPAPGFDQPFPANPLENTVDNQGNLVWTAIAGDGLLGEFYTGVSADYTATVVASRVQRCDMLIDYQMIATYGVSPTTLFLRFMNPASRAGIANVYNFRIDAAGVNTMVFTPATFPIPPPVIVGGAFTDGYDTTRNKIRISIVRIAAGQKRITVNWWDRTAGAMQTAVINHIAAGFGDIPLMFFMNTVANTDGVIIRQLTVADEAIPYGDPVL
jgi:hypothetical protein